MRSYFVLSILVMIFCSCDNGLSHQEYVKYVNTLENGLIQTKNIQNYEFKLKYKPTQYMALQQCITNALPISEVHNIYDEFDGLIQFNFSIKDFGIGGELLNKDEGYETFNDKFFYYAFDVQNDFYLIHEKDTLACKISHMERTYGIKDASTFVLAFEKPSVIKSDLIFYYDDHILNCGLVRFKISKKMLNNLPELKI
jgi:hypothetical protein